MNHTSEAPKRGRPVDIGKRNLILDAATDIFMNKGFHATNMDDIARAARMSKLTLYKRFPDKNSLFRAVVERKCQEALPVNLQSQLQGLSPEAIINAFCHAFFDLIMSHDAIRLYRMMMGEAAQSPDMTHMFYEAGPVRVKAMLDDIFKNFREQGYFKNYDCLEARHTLLSLFTGSDIYMRTLLNVGAPPTSKEVKAFVDRTAAFFIRSYMQV